MSELLLAIDPGSRTCGLAAYHRVDGQWHLYRATSIHQTVPPRQTIVLSSARMIDRCCDWYDDGNPTNAHLTVVFEWPQAYSVGKSKVDPNNLFCLSAIGMGIAARVRADVVHAPLPRDWAMGTSKSTEGDPWDSPRGYRVARRLSETERKLVPASHDAIDAVAIGLWFAGRFEPIRNYEGASK